MGLPDLLQRIFQIGAEGDKSLPPSPWRADHSDPAGATPGAGFPPPGLRLRRRLRGLRSGKQHLACGSLRRPSGNFPTIRRSRRRLRRCHSAAPGNRTRPEKRGMGKHAERPASRASEEARVLQRPDVPSCPRRNASGSRVFSACHMDHVVHRLEQRRQRTEALFLRELPRCQHFVPEQRGEQEARRNRLVRAARVRPCSSAPSSRSALPSAARVSRRASAAGRGATLPGAIATDRRVAWPENSSFIISSNRRADGTVGEPGGARLLIGGAGLSASILEAELCRKAHGRAACARDPPDNAGRDRRSCAGGALSGRRGPSQKSRICSVVGS